MYKPRFKVGDVVQMEDEFSFNPVEKVTSIGQIQAIHIYEGEELLRRRNQQVKSLRGKITYSISGFSLKPEEEDLQLFTGEL